MATTWPLTVEFDVPEPRVDENRLTVSAGGAPDFSGWDMNLSSNVWIDPITRTLMLAPLCVTSAWRTTATGNYARLRKTDYTLTTPSAWVENPRALANAPWLEANGVNEVVRTVANYPANQPWYLRVYVPGLEGLEDLPILECGWGPYGGSSTIWLKFRASGAITVYKGSAPVAVYDSQFSISPGTKSSGKSNAAHGIPILLLPYRRRELLIYLGTNESVSHTFAHLDPAATDNTITPAGIFWWYVPTQRPSVECAPVKFATSGTAYGPPVSLMYAPATGRTSTFNYAADTVGTGTASVVVASIVKATTLGTYTPDGLERNVRLKLEFSDTGAKTLGVYAVDARFEATTTETADAPIDVTERLSSVTVSVDEEGKTQVELMSRDVPGLEDDGVENVEILGDRPYRIALGSVDIVRGTLESPTVTKAEGLAYGIADEIKWRGMDRWRDLEDYTFKSTWAYDGLPLTDAIEDIFTAAGFASSDLAISTDAFELPYTPGVSFGEWQLYPERGDTAAHWIEKLHADFAATWIRGWVPTLSGYKFRFQDPADLGVGPHMTLYLDDTDAQAAGIAPELCMSRTARSVTRWQHLSEANQILVIGQDRRTKEVIAAQYNDAASQAPGTAPASRPDNWRGKTITYQLVDPDLITTQAAANRARNILRDRLTPIRNMIEFEADVLVRDTDDRPIWLGDVVRIYERGRGSYEDFRICAIPKMEFILEDLTGNAVSIRKATYRAEKLRPVTSAPFTADMSLLSADTSQYTADATERP